ncbi:MAG: DUF3108 domain-containing protein [Planctomycetaceae bacterium]|nr:DUF3108 domain-containing protein [Planctomycetaceae bacterium]
MKNYKKIFCFTMAVVLSTLITLANAAAPKVVKTIPANGQQDVSPALAQITIEFDQDMDTGGMSICGGGPNYPQGGKAHWINNRTLVKDVKLQPNHEYEMSVNCPSYQNCKGTNGEPAEIYPLSFKTGSGSAKQNANASLQQSSVLLQQGIYAEETEGNLEKAMGIYTQILTDYTEVERIAARAAYQLGNCYLKKGDKETAAKYLEQVVTNFASQKTIAEKAQAQLDKIKPVDDVISRSYIIHYKAVDQSQDAFEIYRQNRADGVRTHHASRYTENGQTINSICTYTNEEKDKLIDAINKNSKLTLVKVESPKAAKLVQEMYNDIDANGLIHFKMPNKIKNDGSEPITTNGFINSDFVSLTKMYETNGTVIPFETTHEGNIYRYKITFNKPIMPGEEFTYFSEGTIRGLITSVVGQTNTFRYFMNHSPASGVPTLRKETYLLPKDAEVILTSPGMQQTAKDGRIELHVEKVIPPGGSILTEFQYKLAGATIAAAKPLKLEIAPWRENEMLRYDLKTMANAKIGEIIYTVDNILRTDNNDICRIESYISVAANNTQQFTQVDARIDDMTPIYGRTKNQLGYFEANYLPNKINLTIKTSSKSQNNEFTPQETVYDNEEALYLIRRMPLAENYTGKFNIFPVQSGAICQSEIKVTGKEQITVPAGTFDCFKIELAVYTNEIKALQHNVWISADKNKYLVKYDSGQAIMELSQIGFTTNVPNETTQEGVSFKLPVGWYSMINQQESGYKFSIQIISPQMESWAVLTAAQGEGITSMFSSPKQAAEEDIKVLKGYFKNYTVRENRWKDLTIDATPAAAYEADYEEKDSAMVEYRTYILGKSTVYWFVFRVEKDKFEANKADFDSIINSFRTNAK